MSADPWELFRSEPRTFQTPTCGDVALRWLSCASAQRLEKIRSEAANDREFLYRALHDHLAFPEISYEEFRDWPLEDVEAQGRAWSVWESGLSRELPGGKVASKFAAAFDDYAAESAKSLKALVANVRPRLELANSLVTFEPLGSYSQSLFDNLQHQLDAASVFQDLSRSLSQFDATRNLKLAWETTGAAIRSALPLGLANQAIGASYLADAEHFRHLGLAAIAQEAAFRSRLEEYDLLAAATLKSIGLATAMHDFAGGFQQGSLEYLHQRLSFSVSDVYTEFATRPTVLSSVSSLLREAPALAAYSATRSLAVIRREPLELLEDYGDPQSDGELAAIGDELEARLAEVGIAFVTAYRGALEALTRRRHDWCRHTAVSLRELTASLIRHFAPDSELELYFARPGDYKLDGEFTREARLTYIYRDVAVGSYARMGRNHIEITEAIFFPTNAGVHELTSPFTLEQMLVFTRQVQGCISTLLAARGH